MNAETVKLTGQDLLWYEVRQTSTPTSRRSWKGHLLVVLGLITVKLVALLGSQGIVLVTCWLNDTRNLVGCP